MFRQLDDSSRRSGMAWLGSASLHVGFAAVLMLLGGTILKTSLPVRAKSFVFLPSATAPLTARQPVEPKLRVLTAPKPANLPPVRPEPRLVLPDAPEIRAASATPIPPSPEIRVAPAPVPAPPAARAVVQLEGFESGLVKAVQNEPKRNPALIASVAGFDGHNGTTEQNEPKRGVAVGGFAGSETGELQQKSVRSTIPSEAGFGFVSQNGVRAPTQQVARAGFGDVVAAQPGPAARKAAETILSTPVAISYKPRPEYTAEARRLQIQGEVVVETVFRASGDIEILRIIRGLGHGLDESAVAAVRSIRFTPAQQNGRPADSTGIVRMTFALAY